MSYQSSSDSPVLTSLSDYLGALYVSRVLGRGNSQAILAAFSDDLTADESLRSEASAKLVQLNDLQAHTGGDMASRDFAGNLYRIILNEVLG